MSAHPGVDPNSVTPHHRTPIFAAVARDNENVLEILLNHGANLSIKDCDGYTALGVARRRFARRCVNRIRTFQLRMSSLVTTERKSSKTESRLSSQTSCTDYVAPDTVNICSHGNRPFTAKERKRPEVKTVSDFDFPKRSVSFDIDIAKESESNTVSPPSQNGLCQPDSIKHLPTSVTPSSLGTNNFLRTGQRVQPLKSPTSVQFRVTMSPGEKSATRSQEVIAWNDPVTKSEMFRARSAFREGKKHIAKGHSNSVAVLSQSSFEQEKYESTQGSVTQNLEQGIASEARRSNAQTSLYKKDLSLDEAAQAANSLPNVRSECSNRDKRDFSVKKVRKPRPRTGHSTVLR